MEDHHPLDPLLWASIIEDSNLKGVIGDQVIWIHEELQLDPLRLVCVSPIHFVHLLHLQNKRNGGGDSRAQKEANQRKIWKTYSWTLSKMNWLNRSVIT
jgi:hypothetical protein